MEVYAHSDKSDFEGRPLDITHDGCDDLESVAYKAISQGNGFRCSARRITRDTTVGS